VSYEASVVAVRDRTRRLIAVVGSAPRAVVVLLVAGVMGAGAAVALGSVPDATGVIHACYQYTVTGGRTEPAATAYLRVIDPAIQTCNEAAAGPPEQELDWNVNGPEGPQGAQGATGPQGPPGSGQTTTVGNGGTAYVTGSGAQSVTNTSGLLTLTNHGVAAIQAGSVTVQESAAVGGSQPVGTATLGFSATPIKLQLLALSLAKNSSGGGSCKTCIIAILIGRSLPKAQSDEVLVAFESGRPLPPLVIKVNGAAGKVFSYTLEHAVVTGWSIGRAISIDVSAPAVREIVTVK
jgi:hypothetical protein